MEISTFRDWVLVIWGILGIASTVIVTSIIVVVYLKIKSILGEAKETVDKVLKTSTIVSENIVKPIAKVRSFFSSASKLAAAIIKRS